MQKTNNAEVDKLIEYETLDENKIKVPNKISRIHPLVKILLDNYRPNYGSIHMTIKVSSKQLKRATRIFNTLIVQLEKRGYLVAIESPGWRPKIYVTIRKQKIEMRIAEPHKLKPNPKFETYSFENKNIYEATGNLQLRIGSYYNHVTKDLDDLKLENRLNEFIIILLRFSEYERKKKIEFEKQHKQFEEEQRIKKMAEEKIRKENEKILGFIKEVENYILSKQMKEYIDKKREEYILKNGEIVEDSEFGEWLAWANNYVDKIS